MNAQSLIGRLGRFAEILPAVVAGVSAAELLPRYLRRAEAEELRLSAAAETTR